jgi:serine/threonine-protein kinase
LQVLEAGAVLGRTGSPIAIAEGTHQLDLVNEALGFRSRQAATVKAGQLTNLTVAVPNGKLSINAAPWADVWIDGTAAGQTPLANLSLPIGSHEVIFRHPQLGEQRQTAIVKVDGMTRVSVNLQK